MAEKGSVQRDLGTIWSSVGLDYRLFDMGVAHMQQRFRELDASNQAYFDELSRKWSQAGQGMPQAFDLATSQVKEQLGELAAASESHAHHIEQIWEQTGSGLSVPFVQSADRIESSAEQVEGAIKEIAHATDQVAESTKRAGSVVQQSTTDMGRHWERLGTILSLSVTAPLSLVGTQMVRTLSEFGSSMARTAAVSQATRVEWERMTEVARELGATTRYTAREAADGMTFLAMAGFEVNETISAMPGVLQLAASAQLDLATAADITTNILTGYGLAVEDLSRVNDVLVSAMTGANTNLQQLGEAMKYAGPVASAAGIQFEEAAAAIALMGNAGIQASMAGTSLRGALTRLLNPTAQNARLIRDLGLDLYDTNGNLRSLVEIIEELERRQVSAGNMMQLFGQRAGPAMQALVDQGSIALRAFNERLLESEGLAERIATMQEDTLAGSARILKSAYEELSLSLVTSVEPALRTIFDTLADVLRVLADLPEPVQRGAVVFGVATAAAGPLILALRSIATAAAPLLGPAGVVLGVAAALGTLATAFSFANERARAASAQGMAEFAERTLTSARNTREKVDEINRLITRYEHLSSKSERTTQEQEELEDVMIRLRNIQPGLVAGYDDIGKALERNIDPLKRYTEALKQSTDAQIREAGRLAELALPGLRQNLDNLLRRQEALRAQLFMVDEESVMRPLNALVSAWNRAQEEMREGKGVDEALAPVRELLRSGELTLLLTPAFNLDDVDALSLRELENIVSSVQRITHQAEDYARRTREALSQPDFFNQLSDSLVEIDQEIRDVEDAIQRAEIAVDALNRLREGLDPFPEERTPYRFTGFQTALEGEVDAVEETLVEALEREDQIWRARIRLVASGSEEYIRRFGSLQDVTRDYLEWLKSAFADTTLDQEVEAWATEAVESAKRSYEDALSEIREQQAAAEAMAAHAEDPAAQIEMIRAAADEQRRIIQDNHNRIMEEIEAEKKARQDAILVMRASLADTIKETQDQLDQLFKAGPRTIDLMTLQGPDAVWAEIEKMFSAFGPLEERFKDLFREHGMPIDMASLENTKRTIDNFWSYLVTTGQVSASEQAAVIEHQLAQMSLLGERGTDEWLRKSNELSSLIRRMEQDEVRALTQSIETRAALAEAEGRILDSQLLREELQHQQRIANLVEGSEAYANEVLRHELAIANIRREAADEVVRILSESTDQISQAYDAELQSKLRSIDHQLQADQERLRALGATESQILSLVQNSESQKAQVIADWNERRRQRLEQVLIDILREQGKIFEAEQRALELQRDQALMEFANDAEARLRIQEWYNTAYQALIERQTKAEEDLVRSSQERLNALHQSDLQNQLDVIERERVRQIQEAQETITNAERLQTVLTNIESWAAGERERIQRQANHRRLAEEARFQASLLDLQGNTFEAALQRIESERQSALAMATTDVAINQANEIARMKIQSAQRAEAERFLQETLADIDRMATRGQITPLQQADAYEEALEAAQNLFDGVKVSAQSAARVEDQILRLRQQGHSEVFRSMIEDIERRAEREAWSSGKLATELEKQVLAYATTENERVLLEDRIFRLRERQRREDERLEAERNAFLVESGRMTQQELLRNHIRAAEERLELAKRTGDGIEAAQLELNRAERALLEQQLRDTQAMYAAMSELGQFGGGVEGLKAQIAALEELLEQQREFYGESVELQAEYRRNVLELEELESEYALARAERFVEELDLRHSTLEQLITKRALIQEEINAYELLGERGTAALEFLKEAHEKSATDYIAGLRKRYETAVNLDSLSTAQRIKQLSDIVTAEKILLGQQAIMNKAHQDAQMEIIRLQGVLKQEEAEVHVARITQETKSIALLRQQVVELQTLAEVYRSMGDEGALEVVNESLEVAIRRLDSAEASAKRLGSSFLSLLNSQGDGVGRFVGDVIQTMQDESLSLTEATERMMTGLSMNTGDIVSMTITGIVESLRAVSNARKEVDRQAREYAEQRQSDFERFQRLESMGFAGQFETVSRTISEEVKGGLITGIGQFLGLVPREVKKTIEETSESTQMWIERMEKLFNDASQVGRSAMQDAFDDPEMSFLTSLRTGVYDHVRDGLINAFSESQVYMRAMAPLFQAFDQAMEEAFEGGTFDETVFNRIVDPALAQWERDIQALEHPFEKIQNVLNQVQQRLDLPSDDASGVGSSGGVRLTNLTGESRDFLGERLRPLQALDLAPMWHDQHMTRLDTIITLLSGGNGELVGQFRSYLEVQHATIHSGTTMIEIIQSATFTGPIGNVIAQIGEEDAREMIRQIMDRYGLDGGSLARAEGN